MLYELVDKKCLFQEAGKFESKRNVTVRDALITLMEFYDIKPSSGTSQFLDIPI